MREFGDLLRLGSAQTRQPPLKKGLDTLNKCSISERAAMGGRRLKCSGVGEDSICEIRKDC